MNSTDPMTWTRDDYPRDAKCRCGHTSYWHMWPEKNRIGVCDDADYVPPESLAEPCGCTGFKFPLTQDDIITPETLWTCFLGVPECRESGYGPDELYIHLATHRDLISKPAALSIGYGEQP